MFYTGGTNGINTTHPASLQKPSHELTLVIVSARCSAESIPALSNTSEIAVALSTQADEPDEQKIRLNHEASKEERQIFAIESFTPSVKNADESLPGTIHAANMIDVPQMKENNKAPTMHEANMMGVLQIKESNEVLATQIEKLGIHVNGVVSVASALEFDFQKFSLNNIEWMVLGKVYFEKAAISSTEFNSLSAKEMFEKANMKIIDNKEIAKWTAKLWNFQVGVKVIFGKMLWLIQHQNEHNLHIADAAKMAFGSEYLNKRKLPISDRTIKIVTEQNLDRDVMESLIRQDMDSVKWKRKPFAIESFTSSVEDAVADESLPRTKHAASMDISQIKERNEVLAARMEKLGIDIDGVVFVTKALYSALSLFSFNNLELMVLGKVYFEKAAISSTEFSSWSAKEMFEKANMKIVDKKEISKWAARVGGFTIDPKEVFGKMLWLIQHQNEHNLHIADAAKMAFGSEYLFKITLPISDQTIKIVTEQNLDRDVMESLIRQDMNARKLKRKPFAIESFTSSVEDAVADESLPRTKHAASMDISQIKERNEVLATKMEKLGIDIDGVVFVTKGLDSAYSMFSLNNLEWMVLGKVYFEKVDARTLVASTTSKTLFKEANIKITDNEKFTKWRRNLRFFDVEPKKVFGKMLSLIRHQDELNLHIADAAKMAFGSEYLKDKELPISDSLIDAVAVLDVDKGVTESLIRQDKDSIMKEIAGDKLQEKATRKYVGEDLPEQPNKHRKLA